VVEILEDTIIFVWRRSGADDYNVQKDGYIGCNYRATFSSIEVSQHRIRVTGKIPSYYRRN